MPATMTGIAIETDFGIENLKTVCRPVPVPTGTQVLLKINAVSLNFRDLLVIEGSRKIPLPLIPLSDGAGEIVAAGPDVTLFAEGDRAMTVFAPKWTSGPMPIDTVLPTLGGPLDGVLVEYRLFDQSELLRTPAHLTDVDAAVLPCAAVSAWNALFVHGSTRPGDKVVIQGTGGVSLFALQFAKLAGAEVILTSSSDEKLAFGKELGADHLINYRKTPEWGQAVREIARTGVDTVVEIGGAATLKDSIIALKNAGLISFVGFVAGTRPDFELSELGMKAVTIKGTRVGNKTSHADMLRAIELHGLKPVIHREYAFTDSIAALTDFKAGGHVGKVAIRIGG